MILLFTGNGCHVPPIQREDPPIRRGDHAWWVTAQRLMLGRCMYANGGENFYIAIQDQ